MPPDIMAGPLGLAGGVPPGDVAGTGPPGSGVGLAALFAALLARSGSPPQSPAQISPAPKERDAEAKKSLALPKEENAAQTAGTLTGNPILPQWPPALPIQMRPNTLPNAVVAAGKQNAMDTAPVSASSNVKSVENGSGRELPLREAWTSASRPLPAFPGFFLPASGALAPAPAVPAVDSFTALPRAAAAQAAASRAGEAQMSLVAALSPVSSPLPQAEGIVSSAAVLPKTFSFPAAGPSPVAATDGGLGSAIAAALVTPSQALPMPSVVATQAVPIPAVARTMTSLPAPQTLAVEPSPAPVLTQTSSLPPSQAEITAVTAAGPAEPTQTDASVASAPTVTTSAPTVTAAPAVLPAMVAAITSGLPDLKAGTAKETRGETGAISVSRVPDLAETPLKTEAVPADNNTGLLSASNNKTSPAELRLQVVGKRSERRAELTNSEPLKLEATASGTAAADTPAPVLAPMPTVTSGAAAKTETVPLTRTERAEMVRQVADGVGAMRLPTKAGTPEQMTLQLHPKDWGQLQISVRVLSAPPAGALPSQTVTAHIIAETPQVKAALENHSGELRAALREAGLILDRLTVTVQAPGASGQPGETPGHHQTNGGQANSGQTNGGSGFGQSMASQSTSAGNNSGAAAPSNTAASSFAGGAGNPQGGRQGGQPPLAYAAAYAAPEADRGEITERDAPRRPILGQVDMRA